MQITPLSKEKYQEWDQFCLENDDACFPHTTEMLEYVLNHNKESKTTSKSFMITHGSEIIAICPLTIETREFNDKRITEFSFGGSPLPFPAFKKNMEKKNKKKIEQIIFKKIDLLAGENKISRSLFYLCPLSTSFLESRFPKSNVLMEYGYNDISLNSSVIDLTKGLNSIKNSFRRNHKRIIDEEHHLKINTYDKGSITKEAFKRYQEMHYRDAGRVTRTQATFNIMYNWILKRKGVLFELVDKNSISLGFFYVDLYKRGATSGSCCNEPGCDKLGVQHILNWHAIKWLIENDFKYFELGPQKYSYTPYNFPSQKEINISLFKKGFGPETVPLFIGEKFYSKGYYLELTKERNNRFLEVFKQLNEEKENTINKSENARVIC